MLFLTGKENNPQLERGKTKKKVKRKYKFEAK